VLHKSTFTLLYYQEDAVITLTKLGSIRQTSLLY